MENTSPTPSLTPSLRVTSTPSLLQNKVILITGAGAGLGLSLSEKLSARGYTLHGITQTRRHWPEVKRRLKGAPNFYLHQADVTSEAAVRRVVAAIARKEKKIDVLINNAGYAGKLKRLEKESLQELEKNLSSNLVSVFLMSKYTLPHLLKQDDSWLINISSMAGKRSVPQLALYSASKFGVLALSQAIAKENPDSGLHAITVCPGGMNTAMRAKIFGWEDARKQQSPDFVAERIVDILENRIEVPQGGDIVMRYGQITSINPPPEA